MTKQDTIRVIMTLFRDLSRGGQVEALTTLYYEMTDGQKDQFLRETENA